MAMLKQDSSTRTMARHSGDIEGSNAVFEDPGIETIRNMDMDNPYIDKSKELVEYSVMPVMMQDQSDEGEFSERSARGPNYRERLAQMKNRRRRGDGLEPTAKTPGEGGGQGGGGGGGGKGNDHGGIPVGAVRIGADHVEALSDCIKATLRPAVGPGRSLSFRAVEPAVGPKPAAAATATVTATAAATGGGRPLLVHLPTAAAAALDGGDAPGLTDFLSSCGAVYLPGVRRPRDHRDATRMRRNAGPSAAALEGTGTGRGRGREEAGPGLSPGAFSPPAPAAFTFVELFAGVGGFRLGLEALGGRCVLANEIDPHAAAIYRRSFPGGERSGQALVEADVLDLCAASDIPHDADVLTAGLPCQPFSVRGSRPGLADERGHMYRELVRMLRGARPRSFVMENVPGLVTQGGGGGGRGKAKGRGRAGRVLSDMLEAFEECGYDVTWNICNGRHWVPQQRERLYVVGIRSDLGVGRGRRFDWGWYEELLRLTGAREDADADADAGAGAGDDADSMGGGRNRGGVVRDVLEPSSAPSVREAELTEGQWEKMRSNREGAHPGGLRSAVLDLDAKAPTLISSYRRTGNYSSKYVFEERDGSRRGGDDEGGLRPRYLTPRECCRIMGFPEDFPVPAAGSEGDQAFAHWYRGIGNAVLPPVVTAIGRELLDVLK